MILSEYMKWVQRTRSPHPIVNMAFMHTAWNPKLGMCNDLELLSHEDLYDIMRDMDPYDKRVETLAKEIREAIHRRAEQARKDIGHDDTLCYGLGPCDVHPRYVLHK